MTSIQEAANTRASERTGKQSQASRTNGAKSNGPKTAAGKARSARNSRKHGLCSKAEIEQHETNEYNAMRDELLDEIRPVGALEKSAAEHIVHAEWMLQKVRDAERDQDISKGLGSFGNLMLLARYRAFHERSRERAHKQLRDLQTERDLRDGPYKRKPYQDLGRFSSVMAYKRRILEYDHFRGVLPAFAGKLQPGKDLPDEPGNGMEPPPGWPPPMMDLPKRDIRYSPVLK